MADGRLPAISSASARIARTHAGFGDVSGLRYVSGTRLKALRGLKIISIYDLLLHIPRRYLDFSHVTSIAHARVGGEATIVGRVDAVRLKCPRPHLSLVEVDVTDETGAIIATFFRKSWLADQIAVGDSIALSGKVTFFYGFKRMKAPFHEIVHRVGDGSFSYARILPVYPLSSGLSAAWMRRIISAALYDIGDVCDWLPAHLVVRRRLMSEARALRAIHFPATSREMESARRRLAYDELFCLQVALRCRQSALQKATQPYEHVSDGPCFQSLAGLLPFTLTAEQRRAIEDIRIDMAAPQMMNRLLLGDVATGKTVVALHALALCVDSRSQAVVMAPTSVLARQYADRVGSILDKLNISWALLTSALSSAQRRKILANLASGDIQVVFGTSALLADDVSFQRLSLVIIDEQHRFGTVQRARLRAKGCGADLLLMTATPIPRTLALSIYGDLDVSRITQRPFVEAGVKTKLLTFENVDIAYGAIRDAVSSGQQAYVICALVDEEDRSTELDEELGPVGDARRLHAVDKTADELLPNVLPGMRIGKLTGRMKPQEKDEVMERFRAGNIDVLVATTVVEVGVDVPNATVMLVFDADRYGLATLHQLRGRVGRGTCVGSVYLVGAVRDGSRARKRLVALEQLTDGVALAELDLTLRHEGEVLGYRQSGGVTLRMCDFVQDAELIEAAHHDARALVYDDRDLAFPENKLLVQELHRRFGIYFEEIYTSLAGIPGFARSN